MTTLGHDIENGNTQRRHLQIGSQFPNIQEERVVRNDLSASLVVDLSGVDEVLKAAKCFHVIVGKLDDELDSIDWYFPRVVLAVVWRLGEKEVSLDAEGNLIRSNEEDGEEWMRVTARVREFREKLNTHTAMRSAPKPGQPQL